METIDNRKISVPPGCPDHVASSTQDCTGPVNNSVCQEFCPKGIAKAETARTIVATYRCPGVGNKTGLKGPHDLTWQFTGVPARTEITCDFHYQTAPLVSEREK